MSFREKSAWISFVSILLVTAFYFTHVASWSLRPGPDAGAFHLLIISVIALVTIEIIAHVYVAIRAPSEARTPRDERERLIDLKATRIAAYIYAPSSLGVIALIHVGANQFALAYALMLAFAIAQLINYGARIYYHRRGI
jgi:hypothetical protein